MATAGLDHGMLWTDLEGRELNGRWKLNRLVRPEGRTAWFEATGPEGRPAMLSITETLNDEEDLLERLWAAGQIRHPNVVAIREAAVAHVDDTPLVIAVMEPTEENLSDVLRERSLNAMEARQVLDALIAGLGAIHARGLVHGRVEAASVLAMGETIKLRSDCVHLAGTVAMSASEDVRCAGRVVTQAMTRRLPSGENDPVLQLLPEPMARAVRRALSGNASATEIAALAGTRLEVISERREEIRIDPVSKTAPRATAPDVVIPKPQTAVGTKSAVEGTLPADRDLPRGAEKPEAAIRAEAKAQAARRVLPMRPADVRAETMFLFEEEEVATLPASTRLTEEKEPEWGRWPTAPYIVVSAVALILVTVFTLYGILHRKPAAAKAPAAPTVVVERPTAPAKAAAGVAATSQAGAGWRVIAYTYVRREDAEKKAAELARRYPELRPTAYSPREGRYLVSLGGVMSRSDAITLRARALTMGFPGDTYARNYK
ncbi:MAG TPA: SPOR domain-containing protein [Acidobacteriaceae bacterium]|nr:SPOR domain-containing protein [Acidobacteriaceae bacterium]